MGSLGSTNAFLPLASKHATTPLARTSSGGSKHRVVSKQASGPIFKPKVAVILAAGAGTRMAGSQPKPLTKVLGLTLLERVILTLRDAGIERFRVVVSENRAPIETSLRNWNKGRDLNIELIDCPDWSDGNGHSAAAGARGLKEPFLLSMSDHIFDRKIAEKLIAAARQSPDQAFLATDDDIDGVFDLDDATKVSHHDGVITSIGKQINDYDSIDVGLFYMPSWFADRANEQIGQEAHSLSQIMQSLIGDGDLLSCSVSSLMWQDVDNVDMRSEATRRLVQTVIKKTDGPISRLLNRPLSLATSRLLIRLKVSANMATTMVFLLGFVAAWFASIPTWTSAIIAGVLFQLSSVWDGCDGEIARLTHSSSKFGAWYDTITDNIRYAAVIVAVGINVYRRTGQSVYLVAIGAFMVSMAAMVFLFQQYLRQTNSPGTNLVVLAAVEQDNRSTSRNPLLRLLKNLRVFVKQDVLALLIAIALIANQPAAILLGALIVVFSILAVSIPVIVPTLLSSQSASSQSSQQVGKRQIKRQTSTRRDWLNLALVAGGIGTLVIVVTRFPLADISNALAAMGWPALFVPAVAAIWFAANTTGAYALFGGRVRWRTLFLNRVMGDGYNALIPLAGVAGEPIRIHHLAQSVDDDDAIAVVLVDRIINVAAGMLFSALTIGAALWLYAADFGWPVATVEVAAVYCLVSAAVSVGLLYISLTRAPRRFSRWALARLFPRRGRLENESQHGTPLPFHGRQILVALFWHLAGRAAIVIEIGLLLHLLNLDVGLASILVITAVLSAAGILGFLIPQGLGVIEVASVFAFGMIGFSPVAAVAFGLARRGRMLVVSLLGIGLHLWLAKKFGCTIKKTRQQTSEQDGLVKTSTDSEIPLLQGPAIPQLVVENAVDAPQVRRRLELEVDTSPSWTSII